MSGMMTRSAWSRKRSPERRRASNHDASRRPQPKVPCEVRGPSHGVAEGAGMVA
jgi:hypothetical protein